MSVYFIQSVRQDITQQNEMLILALNANLFQVLRTSNIEFKRINKKQCLKTTASQISSMVLYKNLDFEIMNRETHNILHVIHEY